jgi:hypothetical protein
MFILTTAPQIPKDPGHRNHSKDTDYSTLRGHEPKPATPLCVNSQRPRTPPPTHPFLIPTMSISRPSRRGSSLQGERYVVPPPLSVNRLFARIFKYLS